MTFHDYLDIFRNRRIGAMLLLGFASGLPLALTSGTLQAWMTVEGLDIRTIGLFSLVGQAYIFKFLWAPLMDRFTPPLMGRRRGWLVLTQAGLVASIAAMAFTPPHAALWALAGLAVLVAFLSASQDIVFDAYSTDVLHTSERGVGAAVKVLGYRLAMLVSGGLALYLADRVMGWSNMYLLMAGLMALGIITTLWSPEPEVSARPPRSLQEAVVGPLRDFFSRRGAWALLALIVLYKLGDAFAGSLSTTFLIRGVGFSAGEVGIVNKTLGLAATIVGALYGGTLMVRLGLVRALLLFGVLQAVSNLGYWVLAVTPQHLWTMAVAIGIENICGGMGTAAFVALLMALCNRSFSATQYALLSALASIGRVYVGPTSGYLVEAYGWPAFYLMTVVFAFPGLALLWWMRGTIGRYEAEQNERALEAKAAKAASA
ncbi:muropeptide transporter [Ralstonia pickettii]|uniref:muropeptide transporter n=1 Tax=Ralstonia pickettii TaxID=329 RepID=UPI00046934FC|nr:muropeptide transporter [Ralstonia pickettii]